MSYAPRTNENSFSSEINGKSFTFQRVEFGKESAYHVEVIDDDETRYEFRMLHKGVKEWTMEGEQLPPWIMEARQQIEKTINEHE